MQVPVAEGEINQHQTTQLFIYVVLQLYSPALFAIMSVVI